MTKPPEVARLSPAGARLLDSAVQLGSLLAEGNLSATCRFAKDIERALRPPLSLSQIDELIELVELAFIDEPGEPTVLNTLHEMRAEQLVSSLSDPTGAAQELDQPFGVQPELASSPVGEAGERPWTAERVEAETMRSTENGISFETTDRGFKHYEPIASNRGDEVLVYESSAADDAYLWLAVGGCEAHLSVANVERLIDTLRAAIDNHYQSPAPSPVGETRAAWATPSIAAAEFERVVTWLCAQETDLVIGGAMSLVDDYVEDFGIAADLVAGDPDLAAGESRPVEQEGGGDA